MPDPPASVICPKCGCVLSPDAPKGLCAKCLIAGMLDGGMPSAGTGTLPREFGAYVLIEEVARGGMGIVYRARQPQLNRTVALKVMVGGQFAAPDFVERFETEAGAAASLDHPNIVPVYEAGECDGQPFFSMKLIQGRCLAERIADLTSPIPEREAAEMIAKLAHAVHYAHQRGILHRDVKPGNVLLDENGEPYLTDFGLAKLVEKDSALTRTVAMLGTPSYMSPEQARGEAKQLTTAVDVYGLGAIFYELLTGLPPFAGGTTLDTVRQVLEKEPRRPSALRPGLDRDLETICLKCLEKEPERRYGSAEALATDLDRWQRHEPILARPSTPAERIEKWVRRHRALFAALSVIVWVLVVGVSMSVWQAVRATRAESLANERLDDSRLNERRALEARRETSEIAEQRRRELVKMHVAAGNKLVDDGNAFTGLLDFVEALRLEQGDPLREDIHRRRIAGILHTAPQLKQLWMHSGAIDSARFSPDGARVACGDEQGNVQIFDVKTGGPLITPIKTDPPPAVAWFTPEGKYLVTADIEGKIRHWDAATGQPAGPLLPTLVRSIPGRTYNDAVDYSPDGRWLVAIIAEGVRFFAVPSGEPAGPLLAASGGVTRVRFSPDGQTASICGENPSLQIVEVTSGRVIWTPAAPPGPLRRSTFSQDGRKMFTMTKAGADYDIWDLVRGERTIETLHGQSTAYDAQFSPDGRGIALSTGSHVVFLSAGTGSRVGDPIKHESHVIQFEFSPDGEQVATASYDRTARVWDPATSRPLIPALPHTQDVREVRFSPDAEHLLTCEAGNTRLWELRGNDGARLTLTHQMPDGHRIRTGQDSQHFIQFNSAGAVQVWDARSGRVSSFWNEAAAVTAASVNHDVSRLVIAVGGGTVRCREVATGKEIFSVSHPGTVTCLEFSPDGTQFLTAGDDATVRVWNAGNGAPVTPPMVHGGPVGHAGFSAKGDRVMTGSDDKTARAWDVPGGAPFGASLELRSSVDAVSLNKDGTRILTIRHFTTSGKEATMWPGAAQLWDAVTRQPLRPEWMIFSPDRYPAAFSPDGRRFLILQDATTVAICDAATGRRIAPLLEHRYLPGGFAFSPDGRLVLTRAGQMVRVWDAETGEPVSPPLPHGGVTGSAEWISGGRELATTASDGKIRVWDVSPVSSSITELTHLTELLAAHRLDPVAGAVPLTPAEMRERWKAINVGATGR